MRISNSELVAFRRCRRKWYFEGDSQLNLTPMRVPKNLFLGIGVHAALESYHGQGTPCADAFLAWAEAAVAEQARDVGEAWGVVDEEMYAELVALGAGMCDQYEAYDRSRSDFEMLASEQEFAVGIPGMKGHVFIGRFDGVVRDRQGLTWVIEHKTATQFPNSQWYLLQPQTVAYVAAARVLADAGKLPGVAKGTPIMGALWNGLLKRLPTPPRILKDGSVSRDKAVLSSTTASLYRAAIAVTGGREEEYGVELSFLDTREHPHFRRVWVQRTDREVGMFWEQVAQQIRDLTRPNLEIYPNPTMDCAWDCAFVGPCLGMQAGLDVSLELETNYRQRPPRGAVYVGGGYFEGRTS